MDIDLYPLSEDIIYHTILKDDIQTILSQPLYGEALVLEEGFLHFSHKDQVSWVLKTFYKDLSNVMVLGVDKTKLSAQLKIEGGVIPDGIEATLPKHKPFPHLYGPMETDAIVHIFEPSVFFETSPDHSIQSLIDQYEFQRLPVEGTYYRQTFTGDYNQEKQRESTAMIGMYTKEPFSISCFHRLTKDEVWHFYGGDPFRLVLLYPDGSDEEIVMGPDIEEGQYIQYVVPKNVWQAGALMAGGRYALFGCTVAPGFEASDFEGANLNVLRMQYPDRLTDLLYFNINSSHAKMELN